jgi:DNA-binding NarL/FixJ family response regulator
VRVVLADDSALLRDSLAIALTNLGFDVVARAGDADELLALVAETAPDVALVDIRMPPTHQEEGLEAAARIAREFPAVGVLLLSQFVQTGYALRALTGTRSNVGYLLKDRITDLAQLGDALRRVAAGETVVDPVIVQRLLGRRRQDSAVELLTARERDVLSLMAEGRANAAIATALRIGVRTVEAHVASIFVKLGLAPTDEGAHPRVLAVLQYLRR